MRTLYSGNTPVHFIPERSGVLIQVGETGGHTASFATVEEAANRWDSLVSGGAQAFDGTLENPFRGAK